jgi:dTDP-4-dehydrorhamnose 3,5-epimerase
MPITTGEAMRIDGVRLIDIHTTTDIRGSLETFYSTASGATGDFMQWNLVRSAAGVLRGMHAHSRYDEYYVPVSGRMFFGLKDARRASPSFGAADTIRVGDADRIGIVVPAGVAHGVYFETAGILVYGLSTPWTGAHEYGCVWSDTALGLRWPTAAPILSERDAEAPGYAALVDAINADLDVD